LSGGTFRHLNRCQRRSIHHVSSATINQEATHAAMRSRARLRRGRSKRRAARRQDAPPEPRRATLRCDDDESGAAGCTVTVNGPLSPTSTVASFAGDTLYQPAADLQAALIYASAPGGGSFVVGDQTATGSVYFWGDKWWKQNTLSAGDNQAVDPGAFKGFAAGATTQCGGSWSTASGNSAPPPRSPLPAYMAVIVTNRNHKAGAVLSGNIVHVVVVKTNTGYDGDPGHAGTGTVVATVC
jgi:hypothetical protein